MKNRVKGKNEKSEIKELRGEYVSIVYDEVGEFYIELWNGNKYYPFSDLNIEEGKVNEENINQAKNYLIYSNIYALSLLQKHKKERELERLIAVLDESIRNKMKEEGEKITETAIKRILFSDERYQKFQEEVDKLSTISVICKEILNSFNHKRDVLTNLSVYSTNTGRLLMKPSLEGLKEAIKQEKDITDYF